MTLSPALQILDRAWREALRPPPKLTVSQWADRHRRLSRESSAEPGQWTTDRAPYQRAIMDAVSDPSVTDIVVMSSAQVGKTEIINNILGYYIAHDPCPMLVIQPTLEMGEAWSKDRLAPMIRDTPELKARIAQATSRASGNTLRHKVFPGGHVTVSGANSPASLASRPVRLLLGDERDRWPYSAGTEGDPWRLALKRTTTFWNAKRIQCSTPTIANYSAIEREYLASSRERFHVFCPACDAPQSLVWAQVKWDNDDPDTARYECAECATPWDDVTRWRTLHNGEWQADAPDVTTKRGFHISELYSPWVELRTMVDAWLAAKRKPSLLQTFVNTSLGETWEDRGDALDHEILFRRREPWEALPEDCLMLTAGVDVQQDRLEIEIVAWSEDEQSWSAHYEQLWGDPHKPDVWGDLENTLSIQFPTVDGRILTVASCCVDSGYATSEAYKFCAGKQGRRIFAVKGVAGAGRPAVKQPSYIQGPVRCWLYTLGVDNLKGRVFHSLTIAQPGPGYCHFPMDRQMAYFQGLTSEKLERKMTAGRERIGYVQISERNEPLDLRVYATAALAIARPKWSALRVTNRDGDEPDASPAQPSPAQNRRARRPSRPSNWVTSW